MKKRIILFLAILPISLAYSQLNYSYTVTHVYDVSDASIQVEVSNGSGPTNYNYTWYDNTMAVIGSNNSSISGLNEGVYYLKVSDALDSDIYHYIYTYFWVGKYGQTTTLSIQPNGTFGNDLRLVNLPRPGYTNLTNTNYGNDDYLQGYAWSNGGYDQTHKSIIKFDYNGLKPSTASIVNMSLYGYSYGNMPQSNTSVHNEVLVKRIKNGVFWNEQTTTYSSFNSGNSSINVETVGSIEIPEQGTSNTQGNSNFTKTIDISTLAQAHIDQSHENNGMFLELKSQGRFRSQNYRSSDFATASMRPQLTITFTLPKLITTYVPVTKRLDASYVQIQSDKMLRFLYLEEYAENDYQLNYTVYNSKHIAVPFSQILLSKYGDNRRTLDVSSLGELGEVFTLEIRNDKGEIWLLKFRTPESSSSGGGTTNPLPGDPSY